METVAGKQVAGDNLSSQFAGMSKHQLYEIMSKLKVLIEQNQQQARKILIENPDLTKALFQAQVMLGMVQPPQMMPNIHQTLLQPPPQKQSSQSQPLTQTSQSSQPPKVQTTQSLPVHSGLLGQPTTSQPQYPTRQAQSSQSLSTPLPSSSFLIMATPVPPTDTQHSRSFTHSTSSVLPQSSQVHAHPRPPLHSVSPQPSTLHPPISSQGQQQQSSHISGISHQRLQPPLPSQPRPSSFLPFSHQVQAQVGPAAGLQPSQSRISQSMFHSDANTPAGVGPFPRGQPPLPSQPPPRQSYQSGNQAGEFASSPGATLMHRDRGAAWMSGTSDLTTGGATLPGPPPLVPSSVPAHRPPQLTPEMEKALLQQVMSLTPEQINILPQDQRQQVIQLQQMIRR